MSGKQVQRRRGTTQEILTYVGPGKAGEFIFNTETKRIHAMDGVTAGGHPQATITDLEAVRQLLLTAISNIDEIKNIELPKKLEEAYFTSVDGLELKEVLPELKGNKDALDELKVTMETIAGQILTLQGKGFVTLADIEANFKDPSKWFLKEFVKPIETIGPDGQIEVTHVPLESFTDFKNLVERACAGGAAIDQIVADMTDLVQIVETLQSTKLNATDYTVVDAGKINEWAQDGLLNLVLSSEVYTKAQVEEYVKAAIAQAEITGGSLDSETLAGALSMYLSKSEAANTYARLDEMTNYMTQTQVQEVIKGLNIPQDVLGKSIADQYYQLKGDYLIEPDLAPYAKTDEVEVTYLKKNEAFTRDEANASYQPKGDYANRTEIANFINADTVEALYAKKDEVYTKEIADNTFQPMGSYITFDHAKSYMTISRFEVEKEDFINVEVFETTLEGYRQSSVKILESDLDVNLLNKINAAFEGAGDGGATVLPYDDTEVRALITQLQQNKADKTQLEAALAQIANKAETSALVITSDNLAALRQEFEEYKANNGGVSSTDLEAIRTQITDLDNTKASRADVEGISSAVSSLTTTKADKTQINDIETNISALRDASATKQELNTVDQKVIGLDNTKADKTTVEGLENTKADKTQVDDLSGRLSAVENTKADKTELSNVRQELLSKVDTKAEQTQVNQISIDVNNLRSELDQLELNSDNTLLAGRVTTLEETTGQMAENLGQLTVSIGNKASSADLESLTENVMLIEAEVDTKLTQEQADGLYQPKGEYLTAVPEEFVTETELQEAIAGVTFEETFTQTEADALYQPKGDYLTEVPEGFVTEEELTAKGFATEIFVTTKIAEAALEGNDVDLSGYATKDELSGYQPKGDYLTAVPEEYAKKTDLPDISGLATKAELPDVTEFVTEAEVDAKIDAIDIPEVDISGLATKAEVGIEEFKDAVNHNAYVKSIDTSLVFLLDKIAALEAQIEELKAKGEDTTEPEEELEGLRNAVIVPQAQTQIARYSIKNDTIEFSDDLVFSEKEDTETKEMIKALMKEVVEDGVEDDGYPQTFTLTHEIRLVGADDASSDSYDYFPPPEGLEVIKPWNGDDSKASWEQTAYVKVELATIASNRYFWVAEVENWEDPDYVALRMGYIQDSNISTTYLTGEPNRSYKFHIKKVPEYTATMQYKFII